MSDALLLQNSPDEAEKAFEESAAHFRKTNNEVMLAELIDNFGSVKAEKMLSPNHSGYPV